MAEFKARPRKRPPTHPGRILMTALTDAGVSLRKAATAMGVSAMTLSRITDEKDPKPVTADIAARLGVYLGNGSQLWLHMQADYDLWQVEQELRDELAQIEPLKVE
jgi:addiction module HigA family antidote